MDIHHIVAFLQSMDELEMANEVLNMHNRLEAFSSNLDRAAFAAVVAASEELMVENDQQRKRILHLEDLLSTK
jgi:hypothetical protein